jgi:hypothetical protein
MKEEIKEEEAAQRALEKVAQEKLADFAYYWSVEFDNRK